MEIEISTYEFIRPFILLHPLFLKYRPDNSTLFWPILPLTIYFIDPCFRIILLGTNAIVQTNKCSFR